MLIRPARADESAAISALALRSKSHWGYDDAFLEACRDELTWTPAQCASGDICVAEMDGQVAGFFQLTGTGEIGELDALFVDLPWIGRGIGKALMEHALREGGRRGYRELQLDADPGAAPFYAKFNAIQIGSSPSGSIPDRELPRMAILLSKVPTE